MRRSDPPPLATRLLSSLDSGAYTESLIGDLQEQYRQGRSTAWYWRQALTAIIASGANELLNHWLMALWIAGLSASLEQIYMRSGLSRWVNVVDQLWYPRLIASGWSWMVLNPWAYRLQLYFVTVRLAWCGILALLSWIITRLYPRQRGLAVTLLLVPQIALALSYLAAGLSNWLREPANPIAFFGLLWTMIFGLIAVPSSVLLARSGRQRRTHSAQVFRARDLNRAE